MRIIIIFTGGKPLVAQKLQSKLQNLFGSLAGRHRYCLPTTRRNGQALQSIKME